MLLNPDIWVHKPKQLVKGYNVNCNFTKLVYMSYIYETMKPIYIYDMMRLHINIQLLIDLHHDTVSFGEYHATQQTFTINGQIASLHQVLSHVPAPHHPSVAPADMD